MTDELYETKPGELLQMIARLERLLADVAEDVATGQATHTRTAANNKSLAVLNELRPPAVTTTEPIPPDQMCGKPQTPGNEESMVCLERAGHYPKTGHRYGVKPS